MLVSDSILLYLNGFLFGGLPYAALALFLIVSIQRYRRDPFSYSSLSSQFLENRQHFWGLVPFHYGLLVVLSGHLLAFAIPRAILLWNGHPLRLYVLEVSALICGLLTLVGLVSGVARRLRSTKVRGVTSRADWLLFAILLFQVATGILIAIFFGWGSSWFAAALSPYLWSLLKLEPNLVFVTNLPWLIKLHIVSAYLLVAISPFTRLAHALVAPLPYLWRRPQVVRWHGFRGVTPRSGGSR